MTANGRRDRPSGPMDPRLAAGREPGTPGADGFDEEADALDTWVEDYLEGRLPPAETARFERALLEPAVAAAFREALLLRELLASLPPDAPPEALLHRIEEALAVTEAEARRQARRFPRLSAALGGASWALRGPALAFGTAATTVSGTVEASAGPSAMRLTLAPVNALRERGEGRAATAAPKAKSLWRRVLGRTFARGRKEER